jgi:hypothetical protein
MSFVLEVHPKRFLLLEYTGWIFEALRKVLFFHFSFLLSWVQPFIDFSMLCEGESGCDEA